MEDWIAGPSSTAPRRVTSELQPLARRVTGDLPAGRRVLELASGAGLLAIEMAKSGYHQIVALENNRASVEAARAHADREGVAVRVRQGDYSAMPFPANRFDRVVCREGFESFSRPAEVFKEVHRVLKPGGRALFSGVRRNSSLLDLLAFRSRGISLERFEQLAAESGFLKCGTEEQETGYDAWLQKEELPAGEYRRIEL